MRSWRAHKLLATAISYALCIAPDCNTACAMLKKALHNGILRQIEERAVALDERLHLRIRRFGGCWPSRWPVGIL
jgi:hypothetical protein